MLRSPEVVQSVRDISSQTRDSLGRFSRLGNHNGESHQLTDFFPLFSAADNPYLSAALKLLDNGSLNGLTLCQRRSLLVYFAWHNQKGYGIRYHSLGITKPIEIQAIETVGNDSNLEARYERLDGTVRMIRRVEERGFRVPSISEFDYWVYQMWREGKELVKTMANNIPEEFGQNGLPRILRITRINESIQRLRRYGEVANGFKKRRQNIRRTRILKIQREGGENSAEDLKSDFEASPSTLRDDFLTLRRHGHIGPGRVMDPKEKQALMKRILEAIGTREAEGRNYTKGEIGPAEIASALGMDRRFINNFIRKNSQKMKLPKRQNPQEGRTQRKRKIKETVKDLTVKLGPLSTGELVKLLAQSNLGLKEGTLRRYILWALG